MPVPTVTSISPSSGAVGDTIQVFGTNLDQVDYANVGLIYAGGNVINPGEFDFVIPVGVPPGVVDITLAYGGEVDTETVGNIRAITTTSPSLGANFVSFLEVFIYDHSGTVPIDQLEGAYNVSFQDDLNTVGSGSFVIVKSDPKATPSNLAVGNLVRIRLNGQTVFSFWIEEPDEIIASSAGPSGEEMTIAGRGGMAYMDRACVYPVSFPHPAATDIPYPAVGTTGVAPAAILYDQLVKAHARGAIPLLSWDFTDTHDSAGNAWPNLVFDTIHVGDDLLSLSQHIATLAGVSPIEYIFNHDTFTLSAYNAPFGVDRTKSVVWRQGKHFGNNPSRESKHFSAAKSRMLVEGAPGIASANITEVVDPVYEAETNVGRREGYMSYPQSTDIPTLVGVGLGAIKNLEAQTNPFKVSLLHGTDPGMYEPFVDYGIGDFIIVDIPGIHDMTEYRIVSITIGFVGVGNGDYSIDVDLTSPYIAPLLKVKQNILNVLQFATYNNPGGGGGGGGSCCGGEILMAEAFTSSAISRSTDGTVLTIPITIDTPNTRIKVEVHVGIIPTSAGAAFEVQCVGPDGTTRYVPLGTNAIGAWNNGSFVVPPLAVIPPGTYNITLSVLGSSGVPYEMGYQVLVYLVTSGN